MRFLRGDLELVLYFTPSPNSERSATRELVQSLGETLATEFERHEDGQDDDVLERGLRQAVRAAKAGSWEWTLDRDDFWWSEELRRLYGLDADQPTPTHARFLEFVHPEDRSTTQAAIKAALKGQPYDVTHRLLLPGGLVRNVREMGQVIFDPAGRPERLSGVSVDVSEATQAKEDLDLFFAATDELLCVATMDGYFKRINPAWTQLLGYTRQELTSRPFTDFVHPDDRLRTAEAMGVLANGEKVKGFINRYRAADGRYLSMQWNALTGPDGSTIYAVARDVTEAQQAKRKLVATEAQLLQAQKMESVGLLAGGIAHDFNNLLLAIVGYAALVQEELQPESQTWEDAQQILIAGERAGALTRQLLAFSRRQVTVTEEVDLGSVLLHLRKMLIRIIGENIELRIDAETERLWVVADRGQLEQIIVNLAVNARDAMPKGGTLWIALDSAPDQSLPESPSKLDSSTGSVLIRVRDDGVGMSPTTRTRIFEPFFTTKPAGHGTGLGLSTVFGIVQQLEGRIEVDSAPGKGTEFRVYLPRLAPAQNPTPAQAQTQMAPTSRTLGQGLGALVVEDDGAVRELVRRALERTGFHVSLAANAGEGLLLAERATSNFDVMVLDLVMPHLDGLGLAKRLRAAHPNCPILFITGYVDLDKVGNPVDVPASELLLKPFTPTELADKICQLLGLNPGS
ncbi:MAG: PAS domain-containing protein [Myxococcales bacterium]|nr:PAS domain-containing protein [Myxococcales bacterium]